MPTYRNDSTNETRSVKNHLGKTTAVKPGQSIQTFAFLSAPFVETSPLPVYNPVAFRQQVTLSPTGVPVSFDHVVAKTITITDITDTVTEVFNEDSSVTPPLFVGLSVSTPFLPKYDNSDGYVRKLFIRGSGTCVVTGYRT